LKESTETIVGQPGWFIGHGKPAVGKGRTVSLSVGAFGHKTEGKNSTKKESGTGRGEQMGPGKCEILSGPWNKKQAKRFGVEGNGICE